MVRKTETAAFALGFVAISGWAAAAWLAFAAPVSEGPRAFVSSNLWFVTTAVLATAFVVLGAWLIVHRTRSNQEAKTQEARFGYLKDRLAQSAELVTDLRGQIARLETAQTHAAPMMPEGFMSELDHEIIDGNTEREVALAERYVETHSEALLRAFNTLARAALMEDEVDEAQQEHRRAVGLALVGLSVFRGDDTARELSHQLIQVEAQARNAA